MRAIAVLAVVFFHLDFRGFQGGFVGVDVFFVISGYLITSIILDKYENRDFKLSDFYVRRIRRLVPPLIATIAATLFGSALIMTPYDMVEFSRSAAAALFSLSNIVFYLESGYWDAASELKPLLHTWSLGVEEQFYLFWPAIIIGLLAIRRYIAFGTSLALIVLLGAALCICFTGVDQSAAFYLLPFRVFQFALGALLIPLVSILRRRTEAYPGIWPTVAFWVGILCIGISVASFDGNTFFPGWAVLVPTLGAALVLLGGALPGRLHAPARVLMQNPVSLWLGRVSYSMYLVHWPIIALYRYNFGLELAFADQLLLAASTLLATCALHFAVERRFYQRDAGRADQTPAVSGKQFALRTLLVAGLLGLLATSAWKGDGWSWRFPSLDLSEEQIRQGKLDRFGQLGVACPINGILSSENCDFAAPIQLLVLGDSAEVDGFNFVEAGFGADADLNVISFGTVNQCANWREESGHFQTSDAQCQERLDALFDPALIARLNIVLYSANRPYIENKERFLAMLQRLKSMNPEIQVVTLGGYINTKRDCAYYINKTSTSDACAQPDNVSYFEGDPTSSPLFDRFRAIESHYIDRVALLCKNRVLQTCLTRTEEGIPALYDRVHHSLEFAQMSGRMYARQYPDLLHDLLNRSSR